MSFYGNVNNLSRSPFIFDKIYHSRAEMDANASKDDVFIGRYVLVQYEESNVQDENTFAFLKEGKFYISYTNEGDNQPLYGNKVRGKYIIVPGLIIDEEGQKILHNLDEENEDEPSTLDIIYKIGEITNEQLTINNVAEMSSDDTYIVNYNKDKRKYPRLGHGYDSTVWEKVCAQGEEKYVMIASLNSALPVLEMSVDAPTTNTVSPHFDLSNSTNSKYDLHWQAPWGLRIKSAVGEMTAPSEYEDINNKQNYISLTNTYDNLPSDEYTKWGRTFYDKTNKKTFETYFKPTTISDNSYQGVWEKVNENKEVTPNIPAAIYYNKAGFDPNVISYNTEVEDKILLEPTGLSGRKYKTHTNDENANEEMAQVDTQELSIMLPSIGNSIAQMWNVVYGGSTIENGRTRDTFINWEDKSTTKNSGRGLRISSMANDEYNYLPKNGATLAGTINSAHDLMGMIIISKDNFPADTDNLSSYNDDCIYYFKDKKKYYRKERMEEWDKTITTVAALNNSLIDTSNILTPYKFSNSNSTEYYYKRFFGDNSNDYELICDKEYHSGKEYYTVDKTKLSSVEKFNDVYKKNTFYKEENGYYVLSAEESPESNVSYYSISVDKTYPKNSTIFNENLYLATEFKEVTDKNRSDFSKYYVLVNEKYQKATGSFNTNIKYYIPEKYTSVGGDKYSSDKIYFALKYTYSKEGTSYIRIEDYVEVELSGETAFMNNRSRLYTYDKGSNTYISAANKSYNASEKYYEYKFILQPISNVISNFTYQEVNIIPSIDNLYVYYNRGINGSNVSTYTKVTDENKTRFNENNIYCEFTPKEMGNFYVPGKSYYYAEGKGYLIDNRTEPIETTYYSSISDEALKSIISIDLDNCYCIDSNGEFILANNAVHTKDTVYYNINNYPYVFSDTTNEFNIGEKWNIKIKEIPDGVTLKTKTVKSKLVPLEGYGIDNNTMNGLILKADKILNSSNILTRDLNTIQGSINTLNDIISKFGHLEPEKLLATNKTGKIVAADSVWDQKMPENKKVAASEDNIYKTVSMPQNNENLTLYNILQVIDSELYNLKTRVEALENPKE